MRNNGFFSVKATGEQIEYAKKLVEYSIINHTIQDIFKNDKPDTYGRSGIERQKEYRLTGTLGEVVFADVYGLERPKRSYGAIDGQDNGKDFIINIDGTPSIIDLKTMRRKFSRPCADYVLDIPAYQLNKINSETENYFHISIDCIRNAQSDYILNFIGIIPKREIERYGEFFHSGSLRENNFGNKVYFSRDTYEIMLGDLTSPPEPLCESTKHQLIETDIYIRRRNRLDGIV